MPGIYIIVIVFMLASWLVSWRLKSKFKQYSQTPLSSGLSGREIAEMMLADNGITDVRVMSVAGRLTDHYNPADKTVNLSEYVYEARSAAAAAVAAHECGHAVQRILLIGILMLQTTPVPLAIGVALFGLTTIFSFITLPVEFDASKRALAWIDRRGVVTAQEHDMAKDALKWAALTYVVAALGSLATLLYYVSLLMGRRD